MRLSLQRGVLQACTGCSHLTLALPGCPVALGAEAGEEGAGALGPLLTGSCCPCSLSETMITCGNCKGKPRLEGRMGL